MGAYSNFNVTHCIQIVKIPPFFYEREHIFLSRQAGTGSNIKVKKAKTTLQEHDMYNSFFSRNVKGLLGFLYIMFLLEFSSLILDPKTCFRMDGLCKIHLFTFLFIIKVQRVKFRSYQLCSVIFLFIFSVCFKSKICFRTYGIHHNIKLGT